MKLILITLFIAICLNLFGQNIKQLYPNSSAALNFSQDEADAFEKNQQKCHELYGKPDFDFNDLTPEEKEIIDNCDETMESYWDIEGAGCSWYCGGGPDSVSASSYLQSQGNSNYFPGNAHDLDYKTAWVEGVNGYGIGEYLTYYFRAGSPRITEIKVINGYIKSKSAWQNNSRVKSLKLYINNKPFAILNLKDERSCQTFKVNPIGSKRNEKGELIENKPWTLKFEILEVYQGLKYDDVVMSEIYFDGLDVHCFPEGTKIMMGKGSIKQIEKLTIGDSIKSYSTKDKKYIKSVITELANPIHQNLIKITLENGKTISSTKDHPYLSSNGVFVSYTPKSTIQKYQYENVENLQIGTELKLLNSKSKVFSIEEVIGNKQTYTIVNLSNGNTFIANGFIVGTESLK